MRTGAEKNVKCPPTHGPKKSGAHGTKNARLRARLSSSQQEILAQAAALEGQTISRFVITHAQAAAQRTITEHRTLTLNEEDSRAFAEALLAPWNPDEELREHIRRMRETFDR